MRKARRRTHVNGLFEGLGHLLLLIWAKKSVPAHGAQVHHEVRSRAVLQQAAGRHCSSMGGSTPDSRPHTSSSCTTRCTRSCTSCLLSSVASVTA